MARGRYDLRVCRSLRPESIIVWCTCRVRVALCVPTCASRRLSCGAIDLMYSAQTAADDESICEEWLVCSSNLHAVPPSALH